MSGTGLLWKKWIYTVRRKPQATVLIEAETGRLLRRGELQFLAERFHEENLRGTENQRVALCCHNSFAWMIAFLAVQRGQGAVIGMDAGTPAEKQEELARSLGAEWLLSEESGEIFLGSKHKAKGIAVIKLTSGSTGVPKKIPCRAEHLIADGKAVIKGMGIRESDTNLALIPLGHSYALGNVVMPLILQGTRALLVKAFVPSQIPDWIRKYRVTVFPSVPVVFRLLGRIKGRSGLKPLRLAISAGEVLSVETALAFHNRFGLNIHNFYGSSETGGICYDRGGTLSRTDGGVGRPLPGVRVHIAKSGTITVSGCAVAIGGGRFRLADVGRWNGKETLQLLGRRDATANIGGKKVAPAEIQQVLLKLPGTSDAWVGMVRHQQRDILIAAVETSLKATKVEAALGKQLPAWKIPRLFRCMVSLPRNARGKVDTGAVREMMLTGFSGLE